MSTLVLRKTKGSPVTRVEGEANFDNLNTDKIERSGTATAGKLALWDTGSKIKASTYAYSDLLNMDNQTEGTTNKLLTAAEYAKLQTLKCTYIVQVNADGTVAYNPQGLTVEKLGTGYYRITHNLGWYHMDVAWCTSDTGGVAEQSYGNNIYTDFYTYNLSQTPTDLPFTCFLLFNSAL